MKQGLTGCTIAVNCLRLDYPVEACIRSMLPVVDEMLVSDGGSTDGTLEMLDEMARSEPKLRILSHPESLWPDNDQRGNTWVNAVRAEASYNNFCWLDADECLDPGGYDEIRRAVALNEPRVFHYVNFWLDSFHATPWGDSLKAHLKPTSHWMPVHGDNPPGYVNERYSIPRHESLISYHYSALRKREAFIAKCKVIGLRHGFGYADQPLMQSERTGEDFMPLYLDRAANATPFDGRHPMFIHQWLRERGWPVEPPEGLAAEIAALKTAPAPPEPPAVVEADEPEPPPAKPARRFRCDFMDSKGKWAI